MISKTHPEQVTHTKMIPTIIQHNSPATLSWDPSPQNLQPMPQNIHYTGRNGSVLSAILCLKRLTNTIYVCKIDIGSMEWKLLHFTAGAVGISLLAPAKFTFKKYNLLHILKGSARNPYIYTHTYTMYVYTYIHTCIDNLYLILHWKSAKIIQQLSLLEMRLNEIVLLIWHQIFRDSSSRASELLAKKLSFVGKKKKSFEWFEFNFSIN